MSDEAEKQLSEDIDAALRKYYETTGDDSYVIDWMIITSETDPANANSSGIGLLYRNNHISWITSLGMIEAARIRLHAGWLEE